MFKNIFCVGRLVLYICVQFPFLEHGGAPVGIYGKRHFQYPPAARLADDSPADDQPALMEPSGSDPNPLPVSARRGWHCHGHGHRRWCHHG